MTITRQMITLSTRFALLAMLLLTSIATLPHAHAAKNIAEAQNLIYAVDNTSGKAQLYTINPASLAVKALGSRSSKDIQDVSVLPEDELFAATGNKVSGDKGNIYHVDGVTGALTFVGHSGFDQINMMKLRISDFTLWGWSNGKGLVQIDEDTGKATLKFSSTKTFTGMAWQPDGKLYLVNDTELYALNLSKKSLTKQSFSMPKDTKFQSLATLRPGQLLAGVVFQSKPSIFIYDIASKQIQSPASLNTSFKSIQGLCVPLDLQFNL